MGIDVERAARNADGDTYYVPENMTYKEWEKKQRELSKAVEKPKLIPKSHNTSNIKKDEKSVDSGIIEKEKANIVSLNLEDVREYNGKLDNLTVRQWYKKKDEEIPNLIDSSKSLEEQAKQAHNLRNTYRTAARDLMSDQEERKKLDKDQPNISFEDLLAKKREKYGLTGDDAYKDILRSSTTTNKEFDKKAGIKE